MNSRIIRNLGFLLWIIISIGLLFLNIKNGVASIILSLIGGIFGVLGIAVIYENFKGWIALNLGLVAWIYPIINVVGYNFSFKQDVKTVVIAFGILIAMELFFDDSIRNKNAKKRCTIPFEAKCISFAQAGVSTYVPIYRYHIEGRTNTFYGNSLSSVNPKLGDIITVFVNKKNENDVYCPTAKPILMIRYFIRIFNCEFCSWCIYDFIIKENLC